MQRGQPDYSAEATDLQAKALIREGFKRFVGRYKGGNKKGQAKKRRVSKAWIKENMTVGQAGLVLRLMRENTNDPSKLPAGKTAWVITVPPRAFFGVNQTEVKEMTTELLETQVKKLKK